MTGQTPTQADSAATPRPGAGTGRLERAVELLLECVDLLRSEIKEARNDGPTQGEGDHGDSTGGQPAG